MLHSFGDIWFNGRLRGQKIHKGRVFVFLFCLFVWYGEDDGGQKSGWLEFYFHTHKNPSSPIGEIIESSSWSRHLSIIPLKNFHLFKIAKSVINFCLKKISN